MPRPRKPVSPFRYCNSSPEIIRLVVMMYVRFPLSLRNVQDLLSERGIDICHETVRHWWNRFGTLFAADVRRQRISRMRGFRQRKWHLDEVYVKINGELHYLWRAVAQKGVSDPVTGAFPVDPYEQDNANAGADPFKNGKMADHFGGQDGIRRIAERTVELSETDPRIAAIFAAHDTVRLKRTLFEQFCYLLKAGCDYTGRDMKSSHADMGAQRADLNALAENLQQAMRGGGVPFSAQNRFLAKLAPMDRDVVMR